MKRNACLLLLVPLLLAACSARPQPAVMKTVETEEAEPVACPSREPVFLYGGKQAPPRLTLFLAGEPSLLPSGYARLAGVVSGQRRSACVEIGGRGLALGEGELVDDYRITGIAGDRVVLEKN